MLARRRAAAVATAIPVLALLSGGIALAATGGDSRPSVHVAAVSDSTDATTTSTTSVPDTTSTSVGDTTTTTSVEDTTTTSTVDTTTSTVATTTTTIAGGTTATPTTQACKPGWGYGDTNHCHSGPPGLMNNPGLGLGHGHGHGHGNH